MKKFCCYAALLVTLSFVGCKDDPCADVPCIDDPCENVSCVHGACVEGNCVCDVGYEGTDCAAAFNAKVSGTYSLSEVCDMNGFQTGSVVVAPVSGTINQFTIADLRGFSQDLVACTFAADFTTFDIPRQSFGGGFYLIEASGGTVSTDGRIIEMTYRIYYSSNALFLEGCNARLTR